MNENISNFLIKYVEHPDPQYAVMLKGKWGCGKTFFINSWLKNYREAIKENNYVLEPIYVSLYGLNETPQITKAIDRVMHPYLYTKGAEFTKNLLKAVGKIAVKSTLDWSNSGDDNVSFESTLDSLSLLSTHNEEITGTKIIVFDDLERCLIETKLLLGYINNLVEHGGCHVIIVGDETHASVETKLTLIEFKEKTVGREFEILPDNEAAIDYFLNEDLPLCDWLKANKDFILEVFAATQCNNLRILRQSLYDFNVLFSELSMPVSSKNKRLLHSVLANYIVCYCEYRGTFNDLLTNWDFAYANGIIGDKETKDKIAELQSKYKITSARHNIILLDSSLISHIIKEIDTGCSIKEYVKKQISEMSQEETRQERLCGFMKMQNNEFNAECKALTNEINKGSISNIYVLGRSLALLAFFNEKKLYKLTKKTISRVKDQLQNAYLAQDNKESLYNIHSAFYQGINSYGSFLETSRGKEIRDFNNMQFASYDKKTLNKIEKALYNITDENVDTLLRLSHESTPDQHCQYYMTSAFQNIDAKVVFSVVQKLSNASINTFCQFISNHYMFYCTLSNDSNRYSGDGIFLQSLCDLVGKDCEKRKSLDKYMFTKLQKYLEGAVKRANGEILPIFIE